MFKNILIQMCEQEDRKEGRKERTKDGTTSRWQNNKRQTDDRISKRV